MRQTLPPQTHSVFEAVRHLAANGKATFTPADVGARLRAVELPLGAYAVRAELHALEQAGLVTMDTATGIWRLLADAKAQPQTAAGA